MLRLDEQNGTSPTVHAIEARRVVERLLDRLARETLPVPDLDAFGDEFSGAFDRWVVQLVDNLRSPSRT